MNKNKIFTLCLLSLLTLGSCGEQVEENKIPAYYINELPEKVSGFEGQTLTIYNCEDYISSTFDEEEGYIDLIALFEYMYDVKVNYYTFDTVETMYNQMNLQNEGYYDLICPSDYMIQRLINEDKLEKMDSTKLDVYNKYAAKNIKTTLDNMEASVLDENGNKKKLGDYAAGYMWGTMGVIYDPNFVKEEDTYSWDVYWDTDYYKYASIKNSMRDTYVVGILHAYKDELDSRRNELLNGRKEEDLSKEEYDEYLDAYSKILQEVFDRHGEKDIKLVKEELSSLKNNIYGFEVDSGKNDIIDGKIKMNLAWSGDAVYSINEAYSSSEKELYYTVPLEGSNIWYDAWCLPKGSNKDLSYAFINFLSDPAYAAANMNYIGYTSFIASEDVFNTIAPWYGATEYYNDDEYYAVYDDNNELIDASMVHYNNKFYQCIKDSQGNLPTNEEYFEEVSEEDSPLDESYDLSHYFKDLLPEDKESVIYPFDEYYLNTLEAQYPSVNTIKRCAVMNDFGDANDDVVIMWSQVRAYTNMVPYYVILICCLCSIPLYFIYKIYQKINDKKLEKIINNK